ncbi:DUF5018 domain-containing protein [Filimonas effusa]|uniref:DUF5018 domain-containing protein n=1 Tax=Filimonas effusa TaxID=2508721 RepID=A0A4V1M9U4_9BACT|nr:DUF5018 domain-containing protein [Filimonas effusa]RXK82884.1 DUF5018 domain-containing protein [Filimonas effusa]
MKSIQYFLAAVMGLTSCFVACRKADPIPRAASSVLSDIYATLEGNGKDRIFEAVRSNDTIYFNIPYFYPVDSDVSTDITKIIVRSTIPGDAVMRPALGMPMDLSKPVNLEITAGNGTKSNFVLVGRQVADLNLRSASITYVDNGSTQVADGIINNTTNEVSFFIIPGIDVSASVLTSTVNPHSKVSIANGTSINLSTNKTLTVTGVDGSTKVYTLKVVAPVKLNYGVGISRLVWQKGAAEINGFATDNNFRSMAVSGDYLVLAVSTTPSTYRIYNRKTGQYVQNMTAPPGSLRSFAIANDSAGHILVVSYAPKNSVFYAYRYNDAFDASPVKLIQWTNNNPAAISGDGGIGRRVNLFGDLTKNAMVSATAGVSNIIYNWRVEGGAVASNTPAVAPYQSGSWSFYAEAQPVSANAGGDYFVNYANEIALVNGSNNSRSVAFTTETAVVGGSHMAMDYFRFNNANFLGIVTFNSSAATSAGLSVFDVTNTSNIALTSSSADFSKFRVFASAAQLTATSNGNGSADICSCFSDDRESMFVYVMLTNGGVMAYEFTKYSPQ